MNKPTTFLTNFALLALCLFACEGRKTGVKDVFAAFPMEEIKDVMPANWEMEVDDANNRIEIVPASKDEGSSYSRIAFVVYNSTDGGVFVSITAMPYTEVEDLQALYFEGTPSDDKATWQWSRYELYDFLMKDFLAENALTDHAEDKVQPYLDVFPFKDMIHCTINDYRFFMDVQQNLVEDSEYNEAFEHTYLKYDYDFVWEDGKFEKHRSIRKGYDSLCAVTAHELDDPDESVESDYSNVFSTTRSESKGIGEWIEFTLTTSDYPFAGQFFHARNTGINKVRIEIDGKAICRVALLDTDKLQSFPIQKQEVSKDGTRIRFVIEELYPGEEHGDLVLIPVVEETVNDSAQERILKWDGVTPYVYGIVFMFSDSNGASFRADNLDIPDFNIDDNEYFEMNTGDVPEGQDAGYSLKNGVKDKWYRVKFIAEEKELPDGSITDSYITIVKISKYEGDR